MSRFARQGAHGLLLEAEVPPGAQANFEARYLAATGQAVTPGAPKHYHHIGNKWGAELRVYFNDPGMAVSLAASGKAVEYGRKGYLSGIYRYRINNNEFWWNFVEHHGLRLGRS
jgi:hypothetical protein